MLDIDGVLTNLRDPLCVTGLDVTIFCLRHEYIHIYIVYMGDRCIAGITPPVVENKSACKFRKKSTLLLCSTVYGSPVHHWPTNSGGFRGGSEVSMEPPFLAKSKIDRYTKATVVG